MRSLRIAVVACAFACGQVEVEPAAPREQAPVTGRVTLREGDCMPVTTPERCRVAPFAARVVAYDAIVLGTSRPFEPPAGARVVGETRSGPDGAFAFTLPEGRYTILVEHEGRYHPRSYSDGDNEWHAVEVNTRWKEDVAIVVNLATE